MEDETKVTPDASEQEQEVVEETTVESTETNVEEKDWEAEAKKAQEVADNYKKRAEKAEKKAKDAPAAPKMELSQTDVIAIAKSDIHEEDIERVTKFAQMEGISVKEALGNDDMKAILDRRSETRKAAEASNTKSNKGGSTASTGSSLLEQANAGNLPDAKDLTKMWDAQTGK